MRREKGEKGCEHNGPWWKTTVEDYGYLVVTTPEGKNPAMSKY